MSLLFKCPSAGLLLPSPLTRSVSTSPYGRSHVFKQRLPKLPNPVVPHFPQRVVRADGSSYMQWTTSPALTNNFNARHNKQPAVECYATFERSDSTQSFVSVVSNARATSELKSQSKVDKWFNLEIPDSDLFKDYLRKYKAVSVTPTPPPFELQVLLSVPDLTNQVLVHLAHDSSCLRMDPTPKHIVLENWLLNFTPSFAEARGDEYANGVAPSTIYKNGIPLFRNIYSLLRILPSWKLYKNLRRRTSNASKPSIHLRIKGLDDGVSATDILEFDTPPAPNATPLLHQTYIFPAIPHPTGKLFLSVTYLSSPNFQLDALEYFLSSHLLSLDEGPEFILTIAKNQQPDSLSGLPESLFSCTSLPKSSPSSNASSFVLVQEWLHEEVEQQQKQQQRLIDPVSIYVTLQYIASHLEYSLYQDTFSPPSEPGVQVLGSHSDSHLQMPATPPETKEVKVESDEDVDSLDQQGLPAMLQDLTESITKTGDYPVARGGFGEIWKCTYRTDQGPITVAVKSLLVYVSDQLGGVMEKKTNRIHRELRTCAGLKHHNILSVYGYTYGFGLLMAMVIPWAENGNLTTYLEQEDSRLATARRYQILRDITDGLYYLHTNNVIHGDLTGPNVLIHGDGTACLADFGLSLMYSEVTSPAVASWTSTFHGNFRWLAPELLGEPDNELPIRPSKCSDIYSFGGIMLQARLGNFHPPC
ncbi:hypothetical protein EDB19DRAFT_1909457 [Suillus lakei]|nr:hypothetical protein EDB19DRAFT_1909457 [Suillus lakei]